MTNAEKLPLAKHACHIRMGVIEGTHSAKCGHPGGSLDIAEVLSYLYFVEMNVDPKAPKDPDRDRLVLSKGHAAPMLYRNLAEKGFFPVEEMSTLRRMGADPTEVKLLLQNDFQDTMAKYQIIKSARLYRQEIAIAALNSTTSRILAAQAADELLNISGITASFVLYPDGDMVIVSARSIGSANVQMILEPLGGGGNAATAGAQIKNANVKDVLDQLIDSIDKFYEE